MAVQVNSITLKTCMRKPKCLKEKLHFNYLTLVSSGGEKNVIYNYYKNILLVVPTNEAVAMSRPRGASNQHVNKSDRMGSQEQLHCIHLHVITFT